MTIEDILASLQGILDRAEGRNLTDEEVAEYEGLEEQLRAAKKDQEVRTRNAAYRVVTNTVGQPRAAVSTKSDDEQYRAAFDHYMRTGQKNSDLIEYRNQTKGTNSEGGYLVPEEFRRKLVECIESFGGLAANVETITTATGADMPFPTLDDQHSGVLVSEASPAATGTGFDMVFGEKVLKAYRYVAPGGDNVLTGEAHADGMRVSVELLQDSAFDLESRIRTVLGRRIARLQATHWAQGTGSSQPQGIINATGPSDTWTGAAPTYDDLIDAIHSLDPFYRPRAKWVFNDSTMALIEKVKDSNGDPIWRPLGALIGDAPSTGTLLGYPVVIDNSMPAYTDGSGNKFGVFGDLVEAYVIRRVRDIQMIVDPYTRAWNGEVQYWLWARADGLVQNDCAVSVLKND